jgi:transposase
MITRELKLRPNKRQEAALNACDNHGRTCVLVGSANTTKTCSNCGALTVPTGLGGLSERSWECSACGAVHDRDVNSARVILKIGAGWALKGEQ